ncbi:MAG: PDDEXK nuclease domain-containing protein [Prevotellaceae bacterium]|jgi:predicted nuclease of restriction endonuclease-like (RecB) superfamily|nr:PDDEXK nuclease domain-containing protein [Prevotellaceae bacterium]
MNEIIKLSEYRDWLKNLKSQIQGSQIKAALSVNSQMIMLYWNLGEQIVEKQEFAKWGSGFIEQLSKDLREEFPNMRGFSFRNLMFIKQWHLFYSQDYSKVKQLVSLLQCPKNQEDKKVKQLVSKLENNNIEISAQFVPKLLSAEIEQFIKMAQPVPQFEIWEQLVSKLSLVPWGHHILIMQKIKDLDQALFYVHKTIENNWSRAVLEYQIETNLYGRQGKAITNFALTLPEPQGDLANAILKESYNFDFLQLSDKVKETELEKALVQHISHFLPELGIGFAYMGRQFLLKIGKKDYRTDLLFYHTKIKAYIVIELKIKEFEPEYAGKLNFYISAINELVRDERDNSTIGILLCKNKDNYEVEFALKDINNPIGVSTFHYTELAETVKSALPSDEELSNALLNFEKENEQIIDNN